MDISNEEKHYVNASNYAQAIVEIKSKALKNYYDHYAMTALKGSKRKQKRILENWLDKQEVIIQEVADTRRTEDNGGNHDRSFIVGSRLYGKAYLVKLFYDSTIKRISYTRVLETWDTLDTAIRLAKAEESK